MNHGPYERNTEAEIARLIRERESALNAVTEQTMKLDDAWAKLAKAKDLLLRCNDVLQVGYGATDDEREQTAQEVRAFLQKIGAIA